MRRPYSGRRGSYRAGGRRRQLAGTRALELELAPAEALAGDTITRGDMAILICRAQDFMAWLQTL